jgi:hypothetical protein
MASNIILNLRILDKDCSEDEFNEFIAQYNKNNKDLCFKKNGKKTQNIFQFMSKNVSHWELMNYKIYYILKNKKIMAFCLIQDNIINKIVEVTLLCSSTEKKFINGISLGKYLLNIIYEHFVEKQNYLMKIRPATYELIPYYKGWKTPSFDDLDETYGYLIYGNLESTSNETFNKIIRSLRDIKLLQSYLNINININKMTNLQNLKNIFKKKLDEIENYSTNQKKQLSTMIEKIKYVNPKQIKNILAMFTVA